MWPKPGNFTIVIRSNGSAARARKLNNGLYAISQLRKKRERKSHRVKTAVTKWEVVTGKGERTIGQCVQVRRERSASPRTWHRRVIGECRHAEVEAARRRVEELALRQKVRRGCVLRLRLVLVATRRGGRPVRRRGPRVGRVLVVAGVAGVAAGQLQRLALYIVLDEAVFVVYAVALDLGRQVIVLDHRKVRGRGVVVVERRRRHPRSLGRLVVRVRGASLVPTYLRPAQ